MNGHLQEEWPSQWGLYHRRYEHDSCGVGAVIRVEGDPDHSIIQDGLKILINLMHRGAAGADGVTGDGAGILFQVPDRFFREEAAKLGVTLPQAGYYAPAMVFFPQDDRIREQCRDIFEQCFRRSGLRVLGWRLVPTDNRCLGEIARRSEPVVEQGFVDGLGLTGEAFERRLFIARKRTEHQVRRELGPAAADFYVCTASARTICYKGMFLAPQLGAYYPDLSDPRIESRFALVHQRYSTNTFPCWRLAQPLRMICHNGEINTLRANINRIFAHEKRMTCPELLEDLSELFPILEPEGSDSAMFDNVMELLVRAGRSTPHAMMMMVPEAFGPSFHMGVDKRAFYEYHAAIMEPWDGPAAILFTDGRFVGGALDRNGLRPCRYWVTTDQMVIMASEAGVIDIPPDRIREKGRLQPGKMFLVDLEQGRILTDSEVKGRIVRQKPYRRWLQDNRIELRGLYQPLSRFPVDLPTLSRRLRAFGYTQEELQLIIAPMARDGQEPVGCMGNDAALAVLSDQPKLLFNYFKQLFAQVTNPPIDPLREGLVMSLMAFTGKQGNLLEESPEHCRQLKLPHPILTDEDLAYIRSAEVKGIRVADLEMLFDASHPEPGKALEVALERLVDEAAAAIEKGATLIVISDRHVSPTRAPIPSLLATAALHHGLLRRRLRGEVGIIVDSGEPREVMHFCLLLGYGANAINPYLIWELLHKLQLDGLLPQDVELSVLADQYITAIKKGILKTMSKLGISTLRSYWSGQNFEAIGISSAVIQKYFPGTPSAIEGLGLQEIACEAIARHREAFRTPTPGELPLPFGGEYHLRFDGEKHVWDAEVVSLLRQAVQNGDWQKYCEYAEAMNRRIGQCTLRGLLEFVPGEPVPLEEVEPAEEIIKRFCTGAMSHGSISREAHETIAQAMNRLGSMSNSGEGGEDPRRYYPGYRPEFPGDSFNSAIKQVASGRFGVTIEYLASAKMLQIKIAQGAKPGEGGQLPGQKVTEEIARLRYATPGVSLISPPPHHDIYSIEDLAQLIYDLKASNPGVKVSVKLVSESGVGTVAAGVAKGNADEVVISGHDGGTGASPWSSIKHAGTPWELGLAETQQTLVRNNLRDRIQVQVDGQLRTGRDVVIAAMLGADRFGFGTVALVTMGCILLRKCHLGTCSVGVATQRPELRARFAGKPEYLMRFMQYLAEDVRRIMAQLGFRRFEEMIGRVDRLRVRSDITHPKARTLNLSRLLTPPDTSNGSPLRHTRPQEDKLRDHLDWQVLAEVAPALENMSPVRLEVPIRNQHRAVGAILSNHVVKRFGAKGLPDGTIEITFRGTAGQSFGAWLAPGITFRLIGDANDYLGKGLSGGRIVVQTPPEAAYAAAENIIVGNTVLYGATSGQAFINGLAGERFAVRNSGAIAVVEGVGDHGCEYMTGGIVVVLGRTGYNFAAGMSGGIAFVFDEAQLFDTMCNLDMVDLEPVVNPRDVQLLRRLITQHYKWTGSQRAAQILDRWPDMLGRFVKIMPLEYRKVLERAKELESAFTEQVPATEEVYSG
ncbi:MAG: glutamate synthase large subunit [Thermoguttaceae bacterium]|nr:glutamate synthase large subunit [Thermoguttaceae bacterium]MDW8079815.1 glutamate synthase large subunit [Thermoguttaceae bacterium]